MSIDSYQAARAQARHAPALLRAQTITRRRKQSLNRTRTRHEQLVAFLSLHRVFQKASRRDAVLRRRLRVAELATQGRTQVEIADELGVSQPTISADLNEIRAQWREAAEAKTAERIARESP
jgi:DNA-binding NarL/FixJ family response regulator